jgi:hypothetical protein
MKDEKKPEQDIAVKKRRKKKRRRIVLLSILIPLIGFRIALPYIVKNYVNKALANMKGYTGHVEDIDIHIYRGAYVIKGMELKKIMEDGKQDTLPFFSSPEIDLSVEWRALFKGSVTGEIYVERPIVNFSKTPGKKTNAKTDTSDFRTVIKNLMPLKINHFEITNGQLHYIDRFSNPKVDVFMKNINAVASNIKNVNDEKELLPANLKAKANVYGGTFSLDVKFDALNKLPTFDMNARLTNMDMTQLNAFFKAYGNFDVKKGNMGLYTEFAAKDGAFNGYVKPLLKDLDIVQWNKQEGNLGQILWETLVGSVAELLKNQRKDQLATKVPVKGRFDNPKIGLFDAVVYVLKNAFVNALKPSIDNTVNIGNVSTPSEQKKGFFKRIFGRNKKSGKK